MVQAHERAAGRQFLTLARLRLDLAWETPLTMPLVLLPNVVYTTRMNTKVGVNDKWAIGRRAPMGAYLDRVQFIETANRLYNRSGPAAGTRASARHDGLLHYQCPNGVNNQAFICQPRHIQGTEWQQSLEMAGDDEQVTSGDSGGGSKFAKVTATISSPLRRRFTMTSESFLHWSLWRSNVSVGYEPTWMFCKFGNSINTTARICVPRMRNRTGCGSLICQGGLTDCFCKPNTCTSTAWYCQDVAGKQLSLDPWGDGRGPALY